MRWRSFRGAGRAVRTRSAGTRRSGKIWHRPSRSGNDGRRDRPRPRLERGRPEGDAPGSPSEPRATRPPRGAPEHPTPSPARAPTRHARLFRGVSRGSVASKVSLAGSPVDTQQLRPSHPRPRRRGPPLGRRRSRLRRRGAGPWRGGPRNSTGRAAVATSGSHAFPPRPGWTDVRGARTRTPPCDPRTHVPRLSTAAGDAACRRAPPPRPARSARARPRHDAPSRRAARRPGRRVRGRSTGSRPRSCDRASGWRAPATTARWRTGSRRSGGRGSSRTTSCATAGRTCCGGCPTSSSTAWRPSRSTGCTMSVRSAP